MAEAVRRLNYLSSRGEWKIVIISAGAKNLGGLISREFAKSGAKVVVHHHGASSQSDADATVRAINDQWGDAFAIPGDLRKPANGTALFKAAKDRFGDIDIALNNTGKVLRKPIVDTTEGFRLDIRHQC